MGKMVLLFLALGCVFYLLYINGYMITNMKRAIMYIESQRGKHASFDSCTGFTRRVTRFKESRRYHVSFSSELRKGEVSVELLDAKKQQIMHLTGTQQSVEIDINKTKRYYLVVHFKSATGKYDLHWD